MPYGRRVSSPAQGMSIVASSWFFGCGAHETLSSGAPKNGWSPFALLLQPTGVPTQKEIGPPLLGFLQILSPGASTRFFPAMEVGAFFRWFFCACEYKEKGQHMVVVGKHFIFLLIVV